MSETRTQRELVRRTRDKFVDLAAELEPLFEGVSAAQRRRTAAAVREYLENAAESEREKQKLSAVNPGWISLISEVESLILAAR